MKYDRKGLCLYLPDTYTDERNSIKTVLKVLRNTSELKSNFDDILRFSRTNSRARIFITSAILIISNFLINYDFRIKSQFATQLGNAIFAGYKSRTQVTSKLNQSQNFNKSRVHSITMRFKFKCQSESVAKRLITLCPPTCLIFAEFNSSWQKIWERCKQSLLQLYALLLTIISD